MRAESLIWVGGEDEFALTLPLLRALQDRCGDGIGAVYQRLQTGQFKEADITSTLALGLEGGGMKRSEARKKVEDLYSDYGLSKLAATALAVVLSALHGWPDEEEDKTPDEPQEIPESLMKMDFEDIFKTAWKLGLSQNDLERLSVAELSSLMDAHQEYHGEKEDRQPEALTSDKLAELGIGKTFEVENGD